ncbi:hypothetical protein [Desulfosporosinus sp. I2]|uniref:hypothetical protein n=1 Tax=Desulfosporosinus sp. I2 TaxID=1617025 RepID=UPI000AC900FE|nr:hypothetical protein [Desulfosporosinus sp. I2]
MLVVKPIDTACQLVSIGHDDKNIRALKGNLLNKFPDNLWSCKPVTGKYKAYLLLRAFSFPLFFKIYLVN